MTRGLFGLLVFVAAVGAFFALGLGFGLPMLSLPATAVPIGAISDMAVDLTRLDLFSQGQRLVPFQMLYAAAEPGDAAVYMPNSVPLLDAFTNEHGWISRLAFGQMGTLAAPWSDAATPVTGGPFPVILYLPGVTGYMQMGSFQTSALAAQGFVVVTLDQPGAVVAAILPGHQNIQGLTRDQASLLIAPSYRATGLPLPSGFAERLSPATSIVPYFAADVPLLIDRLAEINTDPASLLHGRLDLTHIGVMGMSLGAIVTAQACASEPRIGACLMMDAPVPTQVAVTGLRQPALWISRPKVDQRRERAASGGWPENEIMAQAATIEQAVANSDHAGVVLLQGLFHIDFTDLPAIQPALGWLGQSGAADITAAHQQINQLTASFFVAAFGVAKR